MTQNSQDNIPKIRVLSDIGEAPFQFFGILETILQGWSKAKKKSIYLFKMEDGRWGYYHKPTEQVLGVEQWKEKAAWIDGEWVKMAKYHRIHVNFLQPVTYSNWQSGKKTQSQTHEAQFNITDSSYKTLEEAMKGRGKNSAYKLVFTTRKKKGGGAMTYVEKIVWAEELPDLAS